MKNSPATPSDIRENGLKETSDSFEIFGELAYTLLYWVSELHRKLVERGVQQVYFLSREGQPLKKMFDSYCLVSGSLIQSRYLEVSRRATLLPSLDALSSEKFTTLFRQYRCMSLLEFLSSIGLEENITELLDALAISAKESEQRIDNFPESQLFLKLKNSPKFNSIFDEQRELRRSTFWKYLSSLSDNNVPEELVVVDVGWKGTIQDNLFALLTKEPASSVKKVTGYYIGLVAPGGASSMNVKHGLLFSAVEGRSPRFHVFNENRALFEIILAADHGSAASYQIDADGKAYVVHDAFHEQHMLESQVFPVQRHIFDRFNRLKARNFDLHDIARNHARLVFQPTQNELNWFSSVFHVENYGVFERSSFASTFESPRLSDRLKFLVAVLQRKGRGLLGFWPWKMLNERVGRPIANLYGLIRYLQK
ncbi:hypothetical protein [Pseudomonas sp. GW456-12-1-14-TSB6]|uniref:hypothetical protein n=1 Tax=Pseudomonas sp. GW456-12-1-14-TSB6 TaxID=2751350 RepID=UPI0021155307|nr:hypothetical protein [Pseudomonas sp. GW456-12-1-14-TSB6]